MADAEDKARYVKRALRAIDRQVSRAEQQRRKAEAKRRRALRPGGRGRRRDWDEDGESFEKIRRGSSRSAPSRPSASAESLTHLPRAVVAEVHHNRIVLDNGDAARIAGRLVADPDFRLAVGDEVAYSPTEGPARIEARVERRSWLARPDPGNPHRALVIAANVDLAVIVVAARDPPLRPGLVDRMLLALDHGNVAAITCINKIDLVDGRGRAELVAALAPYVELGTPVIHCSATTGEGIAELRRAVAGRTCVFVGHSGVGKSSLLNAIDPGACRDVGEVRTSDGRGRHTTSWSSLRDLGGGTRVIDTPGVRAFGLDDLDMRQIRAGFPEFAAYAAGCRFGDCSHRHEPGCAVRDAAARGDLSGPRYASYLRIVDADAD